MWLCLLHSLLQTPTVHVEVNDRCGVTYLHVSSIGGVVSRSFAVSKIHTHTLIAAIGPQYAKYRMS